MNLLYRAAAASMIAYMLLVKDAARPTANVGMDPFGQALWTLNFAGLPVPEITRDTNEGPLGTESLRPSWTNINNDGRGDVIITYAAPKGSPYYPGIVKEIIDPKTKKTLFLDQAVDIQIDENGRRIEDIVVTSEKIPVAREPFAATYVDLNGNRASIEHPYEEPWKCHRVIVSYRWVDGTLRPFEVKCAKPPEVARFLKPDGTIFDTQEAASPIPLAGSKRIHLPDLYRRVAKPDGAFEYEHISRLLTGYKQGDDRTPQLEITYPPVLGGRVVEVIDGLTYETLSLENLPKEEENSNSPNTP